MHAQSISPATDSSVSTPTIPPLREREGLGPSDKLFLLPLMFVNLAKCQAMYHSDFPSQKPLPCDDISTADYFIEPMVGDQEPCPGIARLERPV